MRRKTQKTQAASPGPQASALVDERPTPTLETLDSILEEIDEAMGHLGALTKKLRSHKRGSEAYLNVLPDLCVAATVVEAKANSLADEAQAIIEALPDD